MDGYTVEEAAEVLGIPQGRVWELIARGVLAGAAEGRADMRVFLKPAGNERASATGDGGSGERSDEGGKGASAIEASPFRELLTEFRNLTERYGQALLALGEARGEVAALRSRVEVLEARMDMRLPLRAASTVAWEMPDRYAAEPAAQAEPPLPPRPAPMPLHPPEAPPEPMPGPEDQAPAAEPAPSPERVAAAEPVEVEEAPTQAAPAPELPTPSPADETPEVPVVLQAEAADTVEAEASDQPKRRVSGGRAAVAGLAEALARAEDPTLADLPGASEAAEALAALQRETQAVAEPTPPAADETEGESQPPREAAEEPAPPEAEPATAALPMAEPEEEPPAPTTMEVELEEAPQPAPTAEPQPSSVYSTEVVEPDWFADGDFTWLDASSREGELEEPAAAPEAEHLDREEEGPAAEAIQDAFQEPAPAAPMGPDETPAEATADEASPTDATEAEHLDREEGGPAAEAIQEAFDEPDAAHSTEAAPAWPQQDQPPGPDQPPAQDRPPVTGSGSVGFGLFRTDEDRQRAQAPAAGMPGSDAAQEEPLLWFGDEFEAAELEVAAPGWRDQQRLDAAPSAGVALEEERAEAPSDEQIDRLAEEGWGSDEVEAIRSYLGRAGIAGPEPEPPAPGHAADEPTTAHAAEQPAEQPAGSTAEPAPEPGPEPGPSPGPDQDWLRGRRGPAATAYRRLRRLFDS